MAPEPDNLDEVWAFTDVQPEEGSSVLPPSIEIIEGIEPLGEQFGIDPKKTVPDALRGMLFGNSEPTKDEIAKADGDVTKVPPLHSYAILDAAKVTNLPEMLEVSALEHRCFFKGKAYEELRDVAPWIVRLEEGNDFTRHLFTKGDAPWQIWDNDPGIYVRSRMSLDGLWHYFRKFTRVQDENGKWFYFRFYDPSCIAASEALFRSIDRSTRQAPLYPIRIVLAGPNTKRIHSKGFGNGQV